jgi:hypothetical protein
MANEKLRSLKELEESIAKSKQLLERLALNMADLEAQVQSHRKAVEPPKKRRK